MTKKKKDPAAVALGRKSRSNMTPAQATKVAKAAGKARWKGTTKGERSKAMAAVSGKITPAAARARAKKAWATKRHKAEQSKAARKPSP